VSSNPARLSTKENWKQIILITLIGGTKMKDYHSAMMYKKTVSVKSYRKPRGQLVLCSLKMFCNHNLKFWILAVFSMTISQTQVLGTSIKTCFLHLMKKI